MDVQKAYELLYTSALTGIALLLFVMLFRSVKGPGVTDRLLSINMVGTLVIAAIVILSRLLGEAWLLDVALIYTMISLVSVLILARVLIPPKPSRKRFRDEKGRKLPLRVRHEPGSRRRNRGYYGAVLRGAGRGAQRPRTAGSAQMLPAAGIFVGMLPGLVALRRANRILHQSAPLRPHDKTVRGEAA